MHYEMPGITTTTDSVTVRDGITRGDTMSVQHRWQVSLGVLLVMAGLVLTVFMLSYVVLIGMAMVCTGLFILLRAFCMVIKSSHVAVQGHFLLHPRTGTCYTPHQAIAVQRRLDRIRRATEEDRSTVQLPPSPDTNQQSLPGTPPPWQMEPPPSYETVMKNTSGTMTVDTVLREANGNRDLNLK